MDRAFRQWWADWHYLWWFWERFWWGSSQKTNAASRGSRGHYNGDSVDAGLLSLCVVVVGDAQVWSNGRLQREQLPRRAGGAVRPALCHGNVDDAGPDTSRARARHAASSARRSGSNKVIWATRWTLDVSAVARRGGSWLWSSGLLVNVTATDWIWHCVSYRMSSDHRCLVFAGVLLATRRLADVVDFIKWLNRLVGMRLGPQQRIRLNFVH